MGNEAWAKAVMKGLKPGAGALWKDRVNPSEPIETPEGLIAPVEWAAARCMPGTIKELLSMGANPNGTEESISSPLQKAAENGNEGCVAELIQGGVDLSGERSRLAIWKAIERGKEREALMLAQAGVSLEGTVKVWGSAREMGLLGLSVRAGYWKLAERLAKLGAPMGENLGDAIVEGMSGYRFSQNIGLSVGLANRARWEEEKAKLIETMRALIQGGEPRPVAGEALRKAGAMLKAVGREDRRKSGATEPLLGRGKRGGAEEWISLEDMGSQLMGWEAAEEKKELGEEASGPAESGPKARGRMRM